MQRRKVAKTQRKNNLFVSAPLRPCVKSENEISREIVRCAIEAHRTLGGPWLLKSVYEKALAWELNQIGLNVQRQATLPISYKGQLIWLSAIG